MTLPKIDTYCQYSSGNYGAHCLCVEVGRLTVWFSYKTVVAFKLGSLPLVVSENVWGPTTGKHLNAIDGGNKKGRVSRDEFEAKWNTITESQDSLIQAIVAANS